MGDAEAERHKGALPADLRRRLLARLGLPANVRVEELTGGRSARSFLLVYRKHSLVLKIARSRTGDPLFPIRPRIEAEVMQNLAPMGLCAQPVDAFSHGTARCLIYRHLPGSNSPVPGPALARLLRKVHETTLRRQHTLPLSPDAPELLTSSACAFLSSHPDAENLLAAIRRAPQLAKPMGQTLLHGDPVPGNVVWTGSKPMLIDWQCACQGDPSFDISIAISPAMQVIHRQPPLSRDQIRSFLEAYGKPEISTQVDSLAPARHAAMIGHCLWRLDRGDFAYGDALKAEISALETCVRDGI